MKKRILSIVLTIAMLACMIPLGTMTAFARNCEDVTITNPTLWDDGSLKSMDVTFDWAPSGDEHLYVAVLDEHTESYDGWDEYWDQYDEYQQTDSSSIASSIDDFAKYRNINWYSYGGSGSTPTNGYNTINVSFNKGGVPLNVDRNYSLVMFNAPGGTGYRPTDPLGTLKCDSSTLSFENTSGQSAKVEITHTHTFSKEWTVNSTGHWHECTAEGCDIKDYSTCGLEGAAYSKHTGLKDDNTCDICGTVFYRPYDVSYTDSTITLKVNVLDSASEPYTQQNCVRFDAFLRANNSGTAYDANMDFNNNRYYNGTEFAIRETASAAGYCVKNGATYTIVLNAASLDKITGFDENNPYVWLILRPCHAGNGMDYGYSSVNMTYADFYDCSVCLGKFASLKDFQEVKPEITKNKYEVKANGGATISQKIDLKKSTDYCIATVKIKEDNGIDANGNWFVYWVDENGNIISTYSTYSFFVVRDITLTPVYVSRDTYADERAKGIITTDIIRTDINKDGTATIFTERSVSKAAVGDAITQHGVVWTTDVAQADNLVIGDEVNTYAAKVTATDLTGMFRATVDADGADTVYARSYVIGTDGKITYGKTKTIDVTGLATQSVASSSLETMIIQADEVIPNAEEKTETAPSFMTVLMNIIQMIFSLFKSVAALF